MCILLGACGTRTSSSANSGANVDICIGADKPENAFWKELLADGDDEAEGEEGADAQCQWECNEGFTEYAEECYATRKSCVVTTTVVKGEVKEEIAVGVGSSAYQSGSAGEYGHCSEVVSCIAGYDSKSGDSSNCTKTEAGYFSPEGDKSRTACTKPDEHAIWNPDSRGLTSAEDCASASAWKCDTGYKADSAGTSCEVAKTGDTLSCGESRVSSRWE